MAMDIDGIFRVIGEFGSYQRRIFFLVCLPAILVGSANLAYVFIAAAPKYRCVIPGCDNKTDPVYDSSFFNYTIPTINKTGDWDECHRFARRNASDKLNTCNVEEDFSTNYTETCINGSVFDKSVYISTIVSEFDLTCNKAWEANMAQTVYFGGILAGSLISGYVADRIGRMVTIIIGIVGMAAFGITTALVSTLNGFNFVRFMTAVMATTVFQTSFILGTEFVGPSYRVLCGTMPQYFFALGEILLGLVSWWIKDWRMIQLILSAPVSCFVFYWFFIPESPRWLQARGKHLKALAVMERIAKANNNTIPEEMLRVREQTHESNNDECDALLDARNVSMLNVLRNPVLCVRMFLMFYIWIVVTLVYYGLSMNSVTLGQNASAAAPYIDFILMALVEIPGYSLSWFFMSYIGRKYTLMFSLICAGIACGGAGLAAEYGPDYIIVPFLFGKCFITSAFGTVYVFATEMFPTRVRSTILGLCSTHARIGAMLAPFSSSLGNIYLPLPMIVFGSLSIVAGLLNIIMPETKNAKLPDTISEAVSLGRSQILSVQESGTTEEVQGLLSGGFDNDGDNEELNLDFNRLNDQDDNSEDEP